jgi:bis(5'-nucleosyl)-tetraphosphatase (symmetrical)
MAVYAIGDIQGCYRELLKLLETIGFDSECDRLWFTGDLVNRGPQSLEVLRFVKQLGNRAVTVLGNHDLHLLTLAHGVSRKPHKHDTLTSILAAPDREELLDWLRRRPCLYHDDTSGFTLIHAGLPPQWDLAKARQCALEVEAVLRGRDYREFLSTLYGDTPDCWSEDLQGWDRLRFIINCLTRLRYCDRSGRLALNEKGPPGTQAPGLLPWYEIPERASRDVKLIFGHWSTLRLTLESVNKNKVYPLDTGCVWGGELTALRLSDLRFYSVGCYPPPARL